MRNVIGILFLVALLASCNNSAETVEKTEVDSGVEVTFGLDSLEEADTRSLEPEGEQRKSDNMKDSLKVSFPDKKK